MSRALTVSEVEAEIIPLVVRAASRKPAKVIARETGLTERHVRSLRQGEHQPGSAAFLALAYGCPDLRNAVARLLNLTPPTVVGADAALAQIRAIVANSIEEGDQSQPGDSDDS